jgi:hypothetical protein
VDKELGLIVAGKDLLFPIGDDREVFLDEWIAIEKGGIRPIRI